MNFSNNRGYGDFGGLGGFNSFDDQRSAGGSHNQPQRSWLGEDGGTPISASSGMQNSNRGGGTGGGRHQGAGRGGGAGFGGGGPQPLSSNAPANLNYSMQQEMQWLKQDNLTIRNAVLLLEKEKDNLRQAVRKLKVENSRFKQKLKRLSDTIKSTHPNVDSMEHSDMGGMEVDLDYDEIGRDFILVGGVQDPLSLRYEVAIRDAIGIEHKSAERYYWYKMAETFGDTETLAKILEAPNTIKAEEAMKEIKNFDENTWNGVKMNIWEDGQRMKFEQVRWIANLLVHTGKTYIAVASQDKVFGTGWRKNRDEANKPVFWDGENLGGKALMKIRLHLKEKHAWDGPAEEQETEKKYQELKKMVWRRIDPDRRMGMSSGGSGYGGMSGGGGFRGGNRRGGFGGGSGGRPYGGSRGGGR